MGGRYEGYFENILSAKYEARKEKRQKKLKKILGKPLVSGKRKKGKGTRVSIQAGIDALLRLP